MATAKKFELPKRVSLAEVKELLGEQKANQLIVELLRKKARRVMPVSPRHVELVSGLLKDTPVVSTAAVNALGQLMWKRVNESALFAVSVRKYLKSLCEAAHVDKPQARRPKARR